MKEILDASSIKRSLYRISHEIIERNKGVENVVLIGIKTRGETLAYRFQALIKQIENVDVPTTAMDISYWRDDDRKNKNPQLPNLDVDVKDKVVVLVDDVLFRGRTVRAAMDGVMHYGRAKQIQLVILVDRGHKELPIRADFVGKNVPTSLKEEVKVFLKENDGKDSVVIQ
ncbi:MAG: bifunctional pyr operon transcriptional regulator/uracil phosphoribosyltransferase PyrR [Erysipelothrix sp.]|jgi:pyrimidine operon attenuation protein/uracil phosphoribosyltransferase|nr:bifunctional pyr operon transcriptional regulator/uracil phosphoribosyltransferase PyrR [Erysipelothrix sp.]